MVLVNNGRNGSRSFQCDATKLFYINKFIEMLFLMLIEL